MKILMKNVFLRKWQAVITVLLFVFLAGVSFAGVAEDLADGKPLQDVIDDSLLRDVPVAELVKDLIAAGVEGKDIICGLFSGGAEKYEVIAAALDNGMDKTSVVQWSYQCGAVSEDIQKGFSMAGENMPPGMVFQQADQYEENDKEYNYNPPSPSQ